MKQTNINEQYSTSQFNFYEKLHYVYEDQDNIDCKSEIQEKNHDLQSRFNEYVNDIRYKRSSTFIRYKRK